MKKTRNLFSAMLILAALILGITACETPSQGSQDSTKSLSELLSQTSEAKVDLSTATFTLNDNAEIQISKAVELYGGSGQYNLKGAKLVVKAPGVKITNVTNISEIVIDAAVGDGDFSAVTCDVAKMTVNGGGANSIHIEGTTISSVEVAKEGVRLVLEGAASVSALALKAACVLDSTSDDAKIATVSISAEVKNVTLKGKTKIAKVEAKSKDFKLVVASNDVKVETAVVKTDDGTVAPVSVETTEGVKTPEIKIPDGETITDKDPDSGTKTEPTVKKYTITYVSSQGTAPAAKSVEEGYVLTATDLPVLTASGYDFGGWNKKAGDKITENTTITATWIQHKTAAIKVTLAAANDIKITVSESKTTFTADSSYTDYVWKIDGTAVTAKENILEFTPTVKGTYTIRVTAKKNGRIYSATVLVTKE